MQLYTWKYFYFNCMNTEQYAVQQIIVSASSHVTVLPLMSIYLWLPMPGITSYVFWPRSWRRSVGAQELSLWAHHGKAGCRSTEVADRDKLLSICKVGFKPGYGSSSDTKLWFKMHQQNTMTDWVKAAAGLRRISMFGITRVSSLKQDIDNVSDGSTWAVICSETSSLVPSTVTEGKEQSFICIEFLQYCLSRWKTTRKSNAAPGSEQSVSYEN